jgi:hypothetical protein
VRVNFMIDSPEMNFDCNRARHSKLCYHPKVLFQ